MQNSLFKTAASLLQHKGTPAPQQSRSLIQQPRSIFEMPSMCARDQAAFVTRYGRHGGRMSFIETVKIAGGSQRGGIFEDIGFTEINGDEFVADDGFLCPYCKLSNFVFCTVCNRVICFSSVSAGRLFTCAAGCTVRSFIGKLEKIEARQARVSQHASAKPEGSGGFSGGTDRLGLGSGRK